MNTILSVNLNKIALIRNSRGKNYPNLLEFAEKCVAYGAGGLTIHPRPDQRHATYEDVKSLCEFRASHPHIEINIEGYPSGKFLEVVLEHHPDQVTLVPDHPAQLTSDHGWNVNQHRDRLSEVAETLSDTGIRVSLFMDPAMDAIATCAGLEIQRIELYTEDYARSIVESRWAPTLAAYKAAALKALELGFEVNAGHDLNLNNLGRFLSTIPQIREVSIGHALTVEALELGLEQTIRKYQSIISEAGTPKTPEPLHET